MSNPSSPSRVPEDDDDAEMRAMMGFSTFGTTEAARNLKRKGGWEDHADSSSSRPSKTAIGGASAGKGANAIPVGMRRPRDDVDGNKSEATEVAGKRDLAYEAKPSAEGEEMVQVGVKSISRRELQALAKGVTTSTGDVAYFLPTFIEDPWAKLN